MNYQLIHNQIIKKAKQRISEGYTEKHHIIPKCLGGTDSEENIVKLTAKEHFIVHKLLVEIYPFENGLRLAVWMMANVKLEHRDYRIGAREYQRLKENFSVAQSVIQKKRFEDPIERDKMATAATKNWQDLEYRSKMVDAATKNWSTTEHRAKMIKAAKGRIDTEEARKNKSIAAKKRWLNTRNRVHE